MGGSHQSTSELAPWLDLLLIQFAVLLLDRSKVESLLWRGYRKADYSRTDFQQKHLHKGKLLNCVESWNYSLINTTLTKWFMHLCILSVQRQSFVSDFIPLTVQRCSSLIHKDVQRNVAYSCLQGFSQHALALNKVLSSQFLKFSVYTQLMQSCNWAPGH